jgi:hypothetical protein
MATKVELAKLKALAASQHGSSEDMALLKKYKVKLYEGAPKALLITGIYGEVPDSDMKRIEKIVNAHGKELDVLHFKIKKSNGNKSRT